MNENPERRAWRILVGAFTVFLFICAAAGYWLYWYLFESSVTMDVNLTAARGTVRVTSPNTQEEIAVSDRRDKLDTGIEIKTDSTSQALLTFIDPRTDETIASVVIPHDGQLLLQSASAPRFGLNQDDYVIAFSSSLGRHEILVAPDTSREVDFMVESPHASITMSESGQYIVNITDQNTQVTTIEGWAKVIALNSGAQRYVRTNHRTIVDPTESTLTLLESEQSLLINGRFTDRVEVGWETYIDGEPAGTIKDVLIDGRRAILLDHSQENWPGLQLDHSEMGVRQYPRQSVKEYNSIELRATFYVEEQSLSTCGIEGSECPLMIRLLYTDMHGESRELIWGFYSYIAPGIDYPLRCATCAGEHTRININSWYTFRTGNLLAVLPQDQQPSIIRQIWFYASGHAYKVYVSEMDLLVAE
ncbi:MAG: hypothetical protein JXJ17_10560 [Anaerolineae bacterium]|nr:hypothetical protein [Anaerolineae bacterium]